MLICAFLISILTGCNKLYGNPITDTTDTKRIYDESYAVLLSSPAQNKTFYQNDPAPVFTWTVLKGLPQTFIIEIDYMKDGSYMSATAIGGNTYLLPETDWNTIKNNAPTTDGLQKIHWRIKIDYTLYPEEGPYYSGWGYFCIENQLIN